MSPLATANEAADIALGDSGLVGLLPAQHSVLLGGDGERGAGHDAGTADTGRLRLSGRGGLLPGGETGPVLSGKAPVGFGRVHVFSVR
ncbi:hypothetical protein [Nocardiopsis nanhaiensis]